MVEGEHILEDAGAELVVVLVVSWREVYAQRYQPDITSLGRIATLLQVPLCSGPVP